MRQTLRVSGKCSVVEKVKVLIFQPNILCYKYAILWLLCLRGYSNSSMVRGVEKLWRRKSCFEAEIKGCGGCLVVGKAMVQIF